MGQKFFRFSYPLRWIDKFQTLNSTVNDGCFISNRLAKLQRLFQIDRNFFMKLRPEVYKPIRCNKSLNHPPLIVKLLGQRICRLVILVG